MDNNNIKYNKISRLRKIPFSFNDNLYNTIILPVCYICSTQWLYTSTNIIILDNDHYKTETVCYTCADKYNSYDFKYDDCFEFYLNIKLRLQLNNEFLFKKTKKYILFKFGGIFSNEIRKFIY
jgi:hypothetical protein